jgi:uncharacterized glyoxalase superfamily protein PhnB
MIMPIFSVRDLQASISFYRDTLGFKASIVTQGADGQDDFAIVNLGDQVTIGLGLKPEHAHGAVGVSFMVYVPAETDIDAFYATVSAKTSSITQPLHDEYWGDRLFELRDPDGYYLNFCKTTQQMDVSEISEAHRAQQMG